MVLFETVVTEFPLAPSALTWIPKQVEQVLLFTVMLLLVTVPVPVMFVPFGATLPRPTLTAV
jgi:hypothetical protein